MQQPACPFCEKDPMDFFLTSARFGALYNIAPILPGHCMVIPKRHIESVFDLNDDELLEMMQLARKTGKLLKAVFMTDAFDFAIQEKEEAGQSVSHLHLHIVPRKMGDLENPGDWYLQLEKNDSNVIDNESRKRLSPEKLREITERLRERAGQNGLK